MLLQPPLNVVQGHKLRVGGVEGRKTSPATVSARASAACLAAASAHSLSFATHTNALTAASGGTLFSRSK